MTDLLYLNDHYLKEFDATVVEVPEDQSVVFDRTAVYPRGGGQPSDHATITLQDQITELETIDSMKSPERVVHQLSSRIPDELRPGLVGKNLHVVLDWDLRYKHMRHHTALHILSGIVFQKFGAKITGGQIYSDRARLDLSLSDLSKERIKLLESEMNLVVERDCEVRTFWITVEEAMEKPELYRLSADLLPKGVNKLRIVDIIGFDAQLDGGTHVARTSEIGHIGISKTENKGRDNKRIEIVLN